MKPFFKSTPGVVWPLRGVLGSTSTSTGATDRNTRYQHLLLAIYRLDRMVDPYGIEQSCYKTNWQCSGNYLDTATRNLMMPKINRRAAGSVPCDSAVRIGRCIYWDSPSMAPETGRDIRTPRYGHACAEWWAGGNERGFDDGVVDGSCKKGKLLECAECLPIGNLILGLA